MNLDIPVYILPFLICGARILDVSMGTLRTVAVVRGKVLVAAMLGFFEMIIWVLAIGNLVTCLDNPFNVLGYAGGFALGNALGIAIEKKLALGKLVVRMITRDHGEELAEALREAGLRVTEFIGRGKLGPVTLLYVIMDRTDVPAAQRLAESVDPNVFVAIEDTRGANRSLAPTMVPATGWRAVLAKR
jgi:uncharacterized protein YebE (UPF0316 family)